VSAKLKMIVGSKNVFRDLGFPEAEAQNLLLRADLMIAIERHLRKAGLSQTEMAKRLGITQPRLSDLARHRIERFSLDALVNLATNAGLNVRLSVKRAA
jgi:predicted XRE-type DNA-binding protein